jgi:RNA polymerase primary sigma factor
MKRRDDRYDESHDLLNQYLQEISKVPRLTPERERELGRKIQTENDRAAVEELVKANLRFVVSYAKRFRNSQIHFLDLINEGNLGLIQAAKKFDPDKNVKFITYAVWWIRQSILHALSEQGGAFRLPPKRAHLMYRLEKTMATMLNEQNKVPTADELAAHLGVQLKEVQTLLQANNENFSLNAEIDDESHAELIDLIEQTTVPSVEIEMEEQSIRAQLLEQMSNLTSKERIVLTLRHGITDNVPKSVEAIAAFLDIEPASVRELLEDAIGNLCSRLQIAPTELAHLLLYTNPNPKASWTYWVALKDLADKSSVVDRERVPMLENLQHSGSVQRAMEELSLDRRTVLKLRFGILQDEELTLRDIGEILHLSRERVRQIEARAEAKCRRGVRGATR